MTFDRRTLFKAGALGTAAALVPSGISLAQSGRPILTHGVQSGDVTWDGGIVWTRADRPSRMLVEVSHDPKFRHARRLRGPLLTPETGGTGQVRVSSLLPGRPAYYRVTAEDLD